MSCGLLTGGRFNLPFISLPLIKPGPCVGSPIHMQSVTFACSQLDLLRPDWSKPLGPGTHICLQITAASGSSAVALVPRQRLDLASNLKQWSVRIIELICIHWLSLYLHSSVSKHWICRPSPAATVWIWSDWAAHVYSSGFSLYEMCRKDTHTWELCSLCLVMPCLAHEKCIVDAARVVTCSQHALVV